MTLWTGKLAEPSQTKRLPEGKATCRWSRVHRSISSIPGYPSHLLVRTCGGHRRVPLFPECLFAEPLKGLTVSPRFLLIRQPDDTRSVDRGQEQEPPSHSTLKQTSNLSDVERGVRCLFCPAPQERHLAPLPYRRPCPCPPTLKCLPAQDEHLGSACGPQFGSCKGGDSSRWR